MKKIVNFWPIFGFLVFIIVLFNRTLTGAEMIVTPDFGLSDILYMAYPTKFILSEALRHGTIPIWNPDIGAGSPEIGFPTGTFNPINLLLFGFFSTPQAFSFGLASSLFIAAVGMYLFARARGVSRAGAFLAGVAYAFSAAYTVRLVHYPVIQTASMFPLMLWSLDLIVQKNVVQYQKWRYAVFGSIVLGIQILTGFYQMVLYSLIIAGLYGLWRFICLQTGWKTKRHLALVWMGMLIIGFGIGAIQLFPSLELTLESVRSGGVGEQVFHFPYPPKHIVTFLWPYLLGDPRNGTYPLYSNNWGIFWENAGYIGIIPLVLAIAGVIISLRKRNTYVIFVVLLLLTLLLMLGKYSPFFFIYTVPPLSLFRVPARWMLFSVFFLALFSGVGFDWITKKVSKDTIRIIFAACILFFSSFDLLWFAGHYHLRGDTGEWLNTPKTAKFLAPAGGGRIFSYGTRGFWNTIFLKNGWSQGWGDQYMMFLEGLEPNWNIVSGIPQAGVYEIVLTKRDAVFSSVLQNIDLAKGSISPAARRALDLSSVTHVISPFVLRAQGLSEVFKTDTYVPFYIYSNATSLPRVRAVHSARLYRTPGEFSYILSSESFNPATTALIDSEILLSGTGPSAVRIRSETDTEIILEAEMQGEGIVILADTYYPAWHASVDGDITPILPVNMKQRGVVVPDGKHIVRFYFSSNYLLLGSIVSAVSITILIIVVCMALRAYKKR